MAALYFHPVVSSFSLWPPCIADADIIFIFLPCRLFYLLLFTARCNARIASVVLAMAFPSVRPSVTRRYCVKTTARRTVQFALSDSKMYLVCRNQKLFSRDDPFPLKSWLQVTYPLLIAASLDTFCLVAPQW